MLLAGKFVADASEAAAVVKVRDGVAQVVPAELIAAAV
jgi:hypothetical protein